MKYGVTLLFFVLLVTTSLAQKPIAGNTTQPNGDRLNLVSSTRGVINAKTGHVTYYRPVYEHKGSTLSADSGYIYEDEIKKQFFEAFGNVVITQPSGTVIYANQLHYDALAQHAVLTGNVKMIDGLSTLTTNYLTYNMRSKVGTYTGGGRIISQGDTITSKNAYYFENTSDTYFRHKVIVRSPNVKVYTDTMRYNSLTKENFFFGPTNIKGNAGENLYTERGRYNTGTGIANFNKNNLYTEGSKFLKGDSLHYNRDKGFGEAFRNVVFVDTIDKFFAYGGRGLYKQNEESILMTEKPLIISVVKNDSTEVSAVDSSENEPPQKKTKKDVKKREEPPLNTQEIPLTDSIDNSVSILTPINREKNLKSDVDSVYITADTLYSRVILVKDYVPLLLNLDRSGGALITDDDRDYGDEENSSGSLDSISSEIDIISDSLENRVFETDSLVNNPALLPVKTDSIPDMIKKKSTELITKVPIKNTTSSTKKNLPSITGQQTTIEKTLKADSTLRAKTIMPERNEADKRITEALRVAQSTDTTKVNPTDGIDKPTKAVSDTARTRILKAYYNVRLFKSDLQAVADSIYYGMADSMFRFMGRPMIWAQGSQISADTIYMQMINQQLDNALLKSNAFLVNAVLDSVKFNQLKGRKITAFFANNSIENLYVDGNAENISFSADEKKKIITEMLHDRGARIKVKMENKEIIDYITIQKVDQKVYPFKLINQDNEILKGFTWRPQDRPTSKEDLLNRKRKLDDTERSENQNNQKASEENTSAIEPDVE